MSRMPKPKVPEHLVAFPTPEELRAVLATCERDFTGRRDEAILRTFISTGCRLAELAGLRYTPTLDETNDLDLDGERARLMGKGRRERISHLDRNAVKALDRYLRLRATRDDAGSQWLWLGRKGRLTESGVSQMVKQRGQAAGTELHPHALRHYYAHSQLSRGMAEGDHHDARWLAEPRDALPLCGREPHRPGARRSAPACERERGLISPGAANGPVARQPR